MSIFSDLLVLILRLTQGQHVEGNQEGGVKINRQQTWRQYMNRCALFSLMEVKRRG